MYNGIGLTTPRGSGTNGYVIRNLSTLRSYEPAQDRASAWDSAPPKYREPDEGILEHERMRKVEVKCLELQLELEDKGVDEDQIEEQVNALRTKLLANLTALAPSAKSLKPSDTHAIAAAKKIELDRMARALGTRSNYTEGDAFDREKQEENKLKRNLERDEREKRKEEEREKMVEQKAKWEAEKRERDRLRRREEDRIRKEREAGDDLKRKERAPPPPPPTAPRDRGTGMDRPRDFRGDRRSRSRSPPRRRDVPPPPRDRGRPPSRSPSPPPRSRRRFDSRSPSRSRSLSESRSRSRSRSPMAARSMRRSPPGRRERSPPRRRSSPPRKPRSRSPFRAAMPPPAPPAREPRGRSRTRSPPPQKSRGRSASTDSSMSVSTSGGRSRSRD